MHLKRIPAVAQDGDGNAALFQGIERHSDAGQRDHELIDHLDGPATEGLDMPLRRFDRAFRDEATYGFIDREIPAPLLREQIVDALDFVGKGSDGTSSFSKHDLEQTQQRDPFQLVVNRKGVIEVETDPVDRAHDRRVRRRASLVPRRLLRANYGGAGPVTTRTKPFGRIYFASAA